MSDKRLLSSRELANAREIHYETETGKCGWCRLSWPCRPTLLLDHIAALQERIDKAEALSVFVRAYLDACYGAMRIGDVRKLNDAFRATQEQEDG